jgi:hypothetical protein
MRRSRGLSVSAVCSGSSSTRKRRPKTASISGKLRGPKTFMQDLVSSIDACASARPVNAANGVPGEGRQFQSCNLGKADSAPRPAFADTHASSTARRNSLHRSHGLAKALRSGIRLVESFFDGTCSQQNFPQSIAGGLPIWRHDRRSSARLPWADDAPPYAAASILVNDYGPSLPPSEIITRGLIDPILTRWGGSDCHGLRTRARCGFS